MRESRSRLFLEERARAAFPRKQLYDFIMKTVLDGRSRAARLIAGINKQCIFDALDKVPGHGLSKEKISAMFEAGAEKARAHNSKLTDAVKNVFEKGYAGKGFTYNPEWKPGDDPKTAGKEIPVDYTFRQPYSLSHSVWDTVNKTEENLLDVVWGGIAQGRDVRTVAADLMAYAQGGPSVIPGRWGKLEPGTREYVRRLGRAGADYRAIRIYRSEMYRNMQEEAVAEGQKNPACTGEYDWVLLEGRADTRCVCKELAAGGPYEKDRVPDYPHPNCLTKGTKILTSKGLKAIEKVNFGDIIISKDGSLQRVKAIWGTKYDGPLYTIKTRGHKIKATGNHPVFTNSGYIAAKFLEPGQNILSIPSNGVLNISGKPEAHNSPTIADEKTFLFAVLNLLSPVGMPVTAIYFNGKFYFREGNVDVVDTKSVIGYRAEADVYKLLENSGFVLGKETPFNSFGGLNLFSRWAFLPSDSIVGGSGNSDSSVGIRPNVPFMVVRNMVAQFKKVAVNNLPANSKLFGYLINRIVFIAKERPELDGINVNLSHIYERILSIKVKNCKCEVFNLTVENTHEYVANGIVVHNCFCSVEPRLKDDDEFIKELRAYVNGEPEGDGIARWASENGLAEEGFSTPGAGEDTDNTPPRKIERNPNYSGYSPAIARGIESEYLRQYSEREGKEAMSIMKGNEVLGTWEGTRNKINIGLDKDIMSIIKKASFGELTIIHTHMNNTAFSLDDLTVLLNNDTIEVLIVRGVNGNIYTMRIPYNGSRILRRLNQHYNSFYNELLREIPPLDAIKFYHELNQRVADKMRWWLKPSSRQGRKKNMANKNSDEMTLEELDHWSRTELGGISQKDEQHYSIQVALEVAKVMGKDVEAFKKLSPEEQKEKYREYKKEMDALSDEELEERYEKYF